MWNVKIEYKKFVMHIKKRNYFFVSQKNEKLFIFETCYIFAATWQQKYITMTYSKQCPKEKFGVAKKTIFCRNKKFDVAQKVIWCRPKQVDVARKTILRQTKKVYVAQKSVLCRQKQDDDVQKKYFVPKNVISFFQSGGP